MAMATTPQGGWRPVGWRTCRRASPSPSSPGPFFEPNRIVAINGERREPSDTVRDAAQWCQWRGDVLTMCGTRHAPMTAGGETWWDEREADDEACG